LKSNFKAEATDMDSIQTKHKFDKGRQKKMQARTKDKICYQTQSGNQKPVPS